VTKALKFCPSCNLLCSLVSDQIQDICTSLVKMKSCMYIAGLFPSSVRL